jgi:hypothetical protein
LWGQKDLGFNFYHKFDLILSELVYQNVLTTWLLDKFKWVNCYWLFENGAGLPLKTLSLQHTWVEYDMKTVQLELIRNKAQRYITPYLPQSLGELIMEYLVGDRNASLQDIKPHFEDEEEWLAEMERLELRLYPFRNAYLDYKVHGKFNPSWLVNMNGKLLMRFTQSTRDTWNHSRPQKV